LATQAIALDQRTSDAYRIDPRKDIVTVLTCARPVKNCTANMSKSERDFVVEEFARANLLLREQTGARSLSLVETLCEPLRFFERFPNTVLKVIVSAISADEFERALSWCHSKLVTLLYKLESDNAPLRCVPLVMHGTTFENRSQNYPHSKFFVIGVERRKNDDEDDNTANRQPQQAVDLAWAVKEFCNDFQRSDVHSDGSDLSVKHVKSSAVQSEIEKLMQAQNDRK
jgi:poly(A) polymerase Pap1